MLKDQKMFTYSQRFSGLTKQEIQRKNARLNPVITVFTDALTDEYATPYGFINLPFDQSIAEHVQTTIDKKRTIRPRTCIVIGIGGSSVGTRAVYEVLVSTIPPKEKVPLYFFDTIDPSALAQVFTFIEQAYMRKEIILINVVTKSGTTLETVVNFQVIAHCIKRYYPNQYKDLIVITTDQESLLWQWGQEEGITCLPIPIDVGGRYSVFSAVSLFPLGIAGINTDQLLTGARDVTSVCLQDGSDNSAAQLALVMNEWYLKGLSILDFFFFMTEFEWVGKWLRQLIAESVGKRYDIGGNSVRIGIVPTVSIGSSDLHTIAQRYFGGAHTIGTIFYTRSVTSAPSLVVPATPLPKIFVGDISGKDVSEVGYTIARGTQRAYQDQKMAYVSIELPEIKPYYLGQLLQFHMISVVYLARLLHVNAFDQPEVERYKQETRKLLRHE